MALPIREAFTAKAVGIMWENWKKTQATAPYLGRALFGTMYSPSMKLKYITGEDGAPVQLKAANYDAQAPLRNPIGFGTFEQGMPFFREGYLVTEQDEADYEMVVANSDQSFAADVLRRIAMNPIKLVEAADVVPERMIWSLIAPADGIPKITVKVDGGDTYDIAYTADNGVAFKAKHYMSITSATLKWSVPATATPLADIATMKKNFRSNTGNELRHLFMNDTTWQAILACEDTKKQVQGVLAYNAGLYLNEADVRAFIANRYGLIVHVYNKGYMASESASSLTSFIPDYIVTGAAGERPMLGIVKYGPTPEMRKGVAAGGTVQVVNTGVSIYNFTEGHPFRTQCIVSELVLPSFEGMNNIYILNANAS